MPPWRRRRETAVDDLREKAAIGRCSLCKVSHIRVVVGLVGGSVCRPCARWFNDRWEDLPEEEHDDE